MNKTIFFNAFMGFFALFLIPTNFVFASSLIMPNVTPIVTNLTSTSVTVSVSAQELVAIGEADTSRMYYEYYARNLACTMVYPPSGDCAVKTTAMGNLSVTLTGLRPGTDYSAVLKRGSTIACVTTPCPGNEFASNIAIFTTPPAGESNLFKRNLSLGSRGTDVIALQTYLRSRGYFTVLSTGYYGSLTRAAVRKLQAEDMHIAPTGTVGPKTRAFILAAMTNTNGEETFTGTVTNVEVIADGASYIYVDGKKIMTGNTNFAGTMTGIFGRAPYPSASLVGSRVKVFARKDGNTYSLYGNANYYIEVF